MGIDISIAVLAVLLAALGGIVSALALERDLFKWSAIAIFAILGLASVILVVVQSKRAQKEEREAHDRQERIQRTLDDTRLDSAKSIAFLSGRLDALTTLLSHPSGNEELRRIAEAISHSASSGPVKVSNVQLRDAALDLARRLREFQTTISGESTRLMADQMQGSIAVKTQEERNRLFVEFAERATNQSNRERIEFGPLRVEAQNMESQLLNRLPPQPANRIARNVLDMGILAGPKPVSEVADYIERLARILPTN